MTYKELYEKIVENGYENEEVTVKESYIDRDGYPATRKRKVYGFATEKGYIDIG